MWRFFYLSAVTVAAFTDHIDISCNQSAIGSTSNGPVIEFQFTNNRRQQISLHDINHSFTPNMMIHEITGRFQRNSTAPINCNEDECKEQVFQFMALPPGQYLVEMEVATNVIGDAFQLDVVCSNAHDRFDERGILRLEYDCIFFPVTQCIHSMDTQ